MPVKVASDTKDTYSIKRYMEHPDFVAFMGTSEGAKHGATKQQGDNSNIGILPAGTWLNKGSNVRPLMQGMTCKDKTLPCAALVKDKKGKDVMVISANKLAEYVAAATKDGNDANRSKIVSFFARNASFANGTVLALAVGTEWKLVVNVLFSDRSVPAASFRAYAIGLDGVRYQFLASDAKAGFVPLTAGGERPAWDSYARWLLTPPTADPTASAASADASDCRPTPTALSSAPGKWSELHGLPLSEWMRFIAAAKTEKEGLLVRRDRSVLLGVPVRLLHGDNPDSFSIGGVRVGAGSTQEGGAIFTFTNVSKRSLLTMMKRHDAREDMTRVTVQEGGIVIVPQPVAPAPAPASPATATAAASPATAATAADTRIISADALEKLSDDLSVLATADEFRGHMVVSYKPALLGQAVSSMLPANGCAMAIRVAEPAESWRLVSNAFYGATERHFIARGVDGRCYELVSVNNVAVFREMTTTQLPPFLAESSGCKLDASQLTAPLALPMYPPLPPSYLFICQDQNVALTSDRNPGVTNPEDPALFPKALSVKATTPEGTAQLAQFFGQTLPAIAFNRWYEVEYVVGTGILNKDAFVILVNPTSATVSRLLEDSTASLLWSRLEIPSNACSLFSASVVVLKMVSMRKRSVAAVYRLPWSDPYYKLKDGGDASIKAWAARELMPLVIGAAGAATIKIERRKMTLRISTDPNGPPLTLGGDNDSVDMFFHQIVPVYARTRLYDFEYSVEIQETRMLKNSTIARYLVLVNPTKPTLEALALRKDVLPPFVSKVNKGIKETVESDYYQILRGTSVAVFKSSSKANGGKFLLHGHAKYSSSLRGNNGSNGSNGKSNGSPSAPEAPVDGSVNTDANVRAELDVMPEDMADAMPISFFDKLARLMARTATAIKSYQSNKAQKKREVIIQRTRFQAIQR